MIRGFAPAAETPFNRVLEARPVGAQGRHPARRIHWPTHRWGLAASETTKLDAGRPLSAGHARARSRTRRPRSRPRPGPAPRPPSGTPIVITTAPTTTRAVDTRRFHGDSAHAVVFEPPDLTAPLLAGWTKVAGIWPATYPQPTIGGLDVPSGYGLAHAGSGMSMPCSGRIPGFRDTPQLEAWVAGRAVCPGPAASLARTAPGTTPTARAWRFTMSATARSLSL